MMEYDVVIPVAEKHIKQLLTNLYFLKKNLGAKKIYIITNRKLFDKFISCDVNLIDENLLGDGLTYKKVEERIEARGGNTKRTGWYFQQFLKIMYAKVCCNEYYLLWDADTIPVKKISFFNGNKVLFNMKNEYNKAYFQTIDKLFDKKLKYINKSFISEGMMIKRDIMLELISDIEKQEGISFFLQIINKIPIQYLDKSGFSEFETYGSYLINKYPDIYQERELVTLRNGMGKYGRILSKQELMKLNYDTISFEEWDSGFINRLKYYIKALFKYKKV